MKNNIKILKQKRIGIDARFYGPIGKGLGRYTQEIVDNIIKIDQDNEYIIFLSQENYKEFVCDGDRVKKVLAPVRWYSLAEQVMMPVYIWREHLNLMHFPHFNVPVFCPVKFVVTIHDLILTKFPTPRATTLGPIFYKIKNLLYKIVIRVAIKRAKKVIAVSLFTKNDIVNLFKTNPEKIEVTYEGVANLAKNRDSLFSQKLDDREILLGHNIDSSFIFYLGNAYPHKNLEGLLRVFNKIRKNKNNLRLVMAGKEDYFYKRIKGYARELNLWQEGNKNNLVVFPGYVPDSELEVLFRNALAYVFPSFYEGFGLPPLEAMAKGCPVVSSNKTSMPEILGSSAVYFNPDDEEEMQEKIEQVVNNENLRNELVAKGKEWVKKYSWWECAKKTRDIYNSVLK